MQLVRRRNRKPEGTEHGLPSSVSEYVLGERKFGGHEPHWLDLAIDDPCVRVYATDNQSDSRIGDSPKHESDNRRDPAKPEER